MTDSNVRFTLDWGPTAWSKVLGGVGQTDTAREARNQLLLRYHEVVYQYFLLRLRNPDIACHLYSEFALRLLETDRLVRNVDPSKGRFRNYLQRALFNMVKDHFREKAKAPVPLEDDSNVEGETNESDTGFKTVWAQEMLNQAWKTLEQYEKQTGQLSYTVLRYKSEHEAVRSMEMAERLGKKLNRSFTEGGIRQTLHRARERFAALLLEEVERSLGSPGREELEDELRELNLLSHCAKALEARFADKEPRTQ